MKQFFMSSWFLARQVKRLTKKNAAENEVISILDDTVFKAVLSSKSEDSREALRSLLSACTRREVSDVQIVNNEISPFYLGAKRSRLDVHVTFNDGENASLEMQTSKTSDELGKRAEYYAVMLVAGQEAEGKSYRAIKRVYQIFFINDVLYTNSGKIPRRYYYQEETEHDRLSSLTEIIFYELPKLEKRVNDCLEGKVKTEILTKEEKWCIYLRYRHEKRAKTLIKQLCHEEKGIMKAEKAVYKISRSYKRFARKLAERKNSMDRAQELEDREIALAKVLEQGLEQGIEKGIEQGLEKGIEQGLEKGIEQGLEKGLEKGIEQGLEKGLEQGLEKGIEQGMEKSRQYFLDLLNQGLTIEEIKQRLS